MRSRRACISAGDLAQPRPSARVCIPTLGVTSGGPGADETNFNPLLAARDDRRPRTVPVRATQRLSRRRGRSINGSAVGAGVIVARCFADRAAAANHQFPLQPCLVVLVGRLLLLPLLSRLNFIVSAARRSIERT